jgi:hypothetical protein
VKVHLIWTSFTILPVVAATFLVFLGNYISNDYFFYGKKGANKEEVVQGREESQMQVQDSSQIQLNMPREEEPKGD